MQQRLICNEPGNIAELTQQRKIAVHGHATVQVTLIRLPPSPCVVVQVQSIAFLEGAAVV